MRTCNGSLCKGLVYMIFGTCGRICAVDKPCGDVGRCMGFAWTWVMRMRVIQEVLLLSTVLPRLVGRGGWGHAALQRAPLLLGTLTIQQGFGSYSKRCCQLPYCAWIC